MTDRERSTRIDDVAALWAARVDARLLSSEEQLELDAWLAGDVRRQGAYARARAISIYIAQVQRRGRGGDRGELAD